MMKTKMNRMKLDLAQLKTVAGGALSEDPCVNPMTKEAYEECMGFTVTPSAIRDRKRYSLKK